jgi:hypothetical protein
MYLPNDSRHRAVSAMLAHDQQRADPRRIDETTGPELISTTFAVLSSRCISAKWHE